MTTENAKTASTDILPEGYDSFYLTGTSQPEAYSHEYWIKSASQILPQYILQYEFDPDKERRSREKAKCDDCEIATAVVFCAADAANLCAKCDDKLHSGSKLASRHQRTPIGKVKMA